MPNNMRWRYGDTQPVVLPVATDTIIEIGDLVYLDTDQAKPAASQADLSSLAANQEAFHDAFVGVAMQQSRVGDVQPVRIATRGVFELDCAAHEFELGTLVGAAENGAGTQLLNQSTIEVSEPNLAIGRVARRSLGAQSHVLVEIVGTINHGGPQAAA
jgi:hypothetical protein